MALLVAAVAVLASLLVVAARQDDPEPKGYARVTLSKEGCVVDPEARLNAVACTRLGRRRYEVTFTPPLGDSVAVVTATRCCLTGIGQEVTSPRGIGLTLPRRAKLPLTVSIVVP